MLLIDIGGGLAIIEPEVEECNDATFITVDDLSFSWLRKCSALSKCGKSAEEMIEEGVLVLIDGVVEVKKKSQLLSLRFQEICWA